MKITTKKISITVGAIIVIACLIAWYQNSKRSNTDQSNTTTPNPTETAYKPDSISTWKTYTDSEYGFEFKYPSNLVYTTSTNGGEGGPVYKYIEFGPTQFSRLFAVHVYSPASNETPTGKKSLINNWNVFYKESSYTDVSGKGHVDHAWSFQDRNKYTYLFYPNTDEKNEELITQIISTFALKR